MMDDDPKTYRAVTVSSTFTDLHEHRREVSDALAKFDLFPKVMEFDGARADADVIDSSLGFVRDSSAFIGIISHKYGQTPKSPDRNPEDLSISELEFNEAMRLGRPVLLFVMSDNHPVTLADVEQVPEKLAKLKAFKASAKKMREGSEVNRIYETFDSAEDFAKKSAIAVGRLAEFLKRQPVPKTPLLQSEKLEESALPKPPELRAVPRYMGSHAFVGRVSELQTLDEWAGEADPDPMLLFEAIGGSGKSMLTWEWVTNHAVNARNDWAGRFWYSFYEHGALMTDFCRQALAYMTGRPSEDFSKLRIRELSERLINELERRPWLLVLDGLERVLVAYHRIDAAQLRDEDVDMAEDQIANRDPCAAIRPEDDDLLRQLAAVKMPKILVTSRLTPRALINPSNMPLPGVRREFLRGLRPSDAEAMMQGAGIRGDSKKIRDYVQQNCDCHPLVVGVLAGLINKYMPARGDFDVWLDARDGGRALNLADLDLIQSRNHILDAAIQALSPEALQLLQTLALLQRGADYELLMALNPHLPDEADEVDDSSDLAKNNAAKKLNVTIRDLERRGLLQYEHAERRYDLHPVVRGIASGRMRKEERVARGEQVISFFSSRSPSTWNEAADFEDLAPGIQLIATLNQVGRFKEAANIYQGTLSNKLIFAFEAYQECLPLLKSFFPEGWNSDAGNLDYVDQRFLLNSAAIISSKIDEAQALYLYELSLVLKIDNEDAHNICVGLVSLCWQCLRRRRLYARFRLGELARNLAKAYVDQQALFISLLVCFEAASEMGKFERADHFWSKLDPMGRRWGRGNYRSGKAELDRAYDLSRRDALTEKDLSYVEQLAAGDSSRFEVRSLAALRGQYYLSRGNPSLAVESLVQAVRMAREVGQEDARAEALLAIARLKVGHVSGARAEAERLNEEASEAALYVAELWHELDEPERAIAVALRAHEWAVADGEPYVFRYELNRTRALLEELGAELPDVPQYDAEKDPPFDWEEDVKKLIEKLKAERAERERKRP